MSIEVRNLTKHYPDGVRAVYNVSLSIQEGELTAFLGPSGCGKTTLLRMIAGLETPTSGEIRIAGERVDHLPPQKRGVGLVFQNYALFKHMSVFDNVAFGLRIQKRPKDAIADRVRDLLALVGLQGLENRFPDQLSGGQRQRVALARALAPEPRLLLLDEPFSAVDAKIRKELREWIVRLHDEVGITSIFVTHDQQEALEVADRVAVLDHGVLQQFGAPRAIYDHPANPFVARFIGDVNLYHTRVRKGYADLGTLQVEAGAFADGDEVEVVVRPEDVRVAPVVNNQGTTGLVRQSVFLGDRFKLEVELAQEVRIVAHVPKETGSQFPVGCYVAVEVQGGKVFLPEKSRGTREPFSPVPEEAPLYQVKAAESS